MKISSAKYRPFCLGLNVVNRCGLLSHSRLIPICNAFFIQRGHRRSLPIFPIGEESDGGHRIKRALYIGIKRLCLESIRRNRPVSSLIQVCFVAYSAPIHQLNQWWIIVNGATRNIFDKILFGIQTFSSRKCIWNWHLEMSVIFSLPKFVYFCIYLPFNIFPCPFPCFLMDVSCCVCINQNDYTWFHTECYSFTRHKQVISSVGPCLIQPQMSARETNGGCCWHNFSPCMPYCYRQSMILISSAVT